MGMQRRDRRNGRESISGERTVGRRRRHQQTVIDGRAEPRTYQRRACGEKAAKISAYGHRLKSREGISGERAVV